MQGGGVFRVAVEQPLFGVVFGSCLLLIDSLLFMNLYRRLCFSGIYIKINQLQLEGIKNSLGTFYMMRTKQICRQKESMKLFHFSSIQIK